MALPTMGQQSNKTIKRRRRVDYLKRKKEQAKLGGLAKKSPAVKKTAVVVKKAPATTAPASAEAPAKKAPAKKAPAKKAAAKKVEETQTDAPASSGEES